MCEAMSSPVRKRSCLNGWMSDLLHIVPFGSCLDCSQRWYVYRRDPCFDLGPVHPRISISTQDGEYLTYGQYALDDIPRSIFTTNP